MRKRVGKMATEIPFPYRVVRSRKRRTASLSIDMGQVEVRVPALVDNAWVEQWLLSKSDWVLPRLARQQEDLADHEIRIEPGAQIFVAGEPRHIRDPQDDNRTQISVVDISRAYFCADAGPENPTYVAPPPI